MTGLEIGLLILAWIISVIIAFIIGGAIGCGYSTKDDKSINCYH